MFCAKCGFQISASDQFCPKCGNENPSYVQDATEKSTKSADNYCKKSFTKLSVFIPIAIVLVIILFATSIAIILKNKSNNHIILDNDNVKYSPQGLFAFIDQKGIGYFVDDGAVYSFEGRINKGKTTPDHGKAVVLFSDGHLNLFDNKTDSNTEICTFANELSRVSNTGCFYTTGANSHLYYYCFKDGSNIDTGMENCEYHYSYNGNAVFGINSNGFVKSFSCKKRETNELCRIDVNSDICCVSDDANNLIWSENDGNTYDIYTIKNGAPERIGKITNGDKYSYIHGFYYDNCKKYIVYSTGSSQIIRGNSSNIQEIVLPGVKNYDSFYDKNEYEIDSEDDNINEPYLIVTRTKTSDIGSLYKITPDGSLEIEMTGIKESSTYSFQKSYMYYLRGNYLYYVDKNGDLYSHKLGVDSDSSIISTAVDDVFISQQGKYAYIIKSGSLYYIDLRSKDYSLKSISNNFAKDYSVYLTDRDDIIYYIPERKEIPDSYSSKGTLYKFKVKGSTQAVTKDVSYVVKNDNEFIDSDCPIIKQYESKHGSTTFYNIGKYENGTYTELIHSAN